MSASRAGGGRRWMFWAPLLAVSAWLAFFGERPAGSSAAVSLPTRPPAAVQPAPRTQDATRPARAAQDDTLATLLPRERLLAAAPPLADAQVAARDPFSARSWNPPPPPAQATEPVAPTAPPLPYAFIGKKQEGETWEVYLSRGEHTFVAREGETLEGSYRVERVAPPTLTVTYLPLGQEQTLAIGDAR